MKSIRLAPVVLWLGASCAYADFSYEQTSKVTGGVAATALKVVSVFSKKASEPVRTSVLVKGERMANAGADQITVIDLGRETITDIHLQKKTYSVMTFAEMTKAMEKMMRKASEKRGQDVDMKFKAGIKDTGERKSINGLDTRQLILTLEMEGKDRKSGDSGAFRVICDMWMAAKVPGYDEVKRFYLLMAQRMAWSPGSRGFMQGDSEMARAFAGLQKEAAKLDGVPVLQVTKMTGAAAGQPGQAEQPAAEARPAEETSKPSIGGALGRLGGFGGLGRKKKQPEAEQSAPQAAPRSGPASLLEMTTESGNFSTAAIDASKFEVPAGFRQIENESVKGLGK